MEIRDESGVVDKQIFEYHPLWKIVALIFRIFGVLLGLFFFFVEINIFISIFGLLIFLYAFVSFVDIVLFASIEFSADKIIKKWSFFSFDITKEIRYEVIEVTVSKRFFGGMLMLWEKGKRLQTALFFILDLMPITNNEFRAIKQILIEKKIIGGDEHEWNY